MQRNGDLADGGWCRRLRTEKPLRQRMHSFAETSLAQSASACLARVLAALSVALSAPPTAPS